MVQRRSDISERDLRRSIIYELEKRGSIVLYVANEAVRSRFNQAGLVKGFPDLIVFSKGGKVVLLELKAKRGRITEKQSEVIQKLINLGFEVYVVRSLNEALEVVYG